MNDRDLDLARDLDRDLDDDLDLGVEQEAALRARLAAAAATAEVRSDAWERISARTSGDPEPRSARFSGRRRVVAAAAVLLLAGAGAVTEREDAGRDQVTTSEDTHIVGDDADDPDRVPPDHDEDVTSEPPPPRPESQPEPPVGDGGDEAGPADGGRGAVVDAAGSTGGPGAGAAPVPTTDPPTPPGTGTTTTTAPPAPPPRLPGDIVVHTSSGFDVELVLEHVPGRVSAVIRRTDSPYDGSAGTRGLISDGYTFAAGVVLVGVDPTYGPTCVRSGAVAVRGVEPHVFTTGLLGSGIAAVRVVMSNGAEIPALVTGRSVANGIRSYLAEVPTTDVVGVDAYGTDGELVVSTRSPDNHQCGVDDATGG